MFCSLTEVTSIQQNPYVNFLRIIHIWYYLTMKKRLGQAHGIDQLLPHRPDGNLVVYCPACPKPGFNIEKEQKLLPHWARYYMHFTI
jgi:hypothetical protein